MNLAEQNWNFIIIFSADPFFRSLLSMTKQMQDNYSKKQKIQLTHQQTMLQSELEKRQPLLASTAINKKNPPPK